MRNGVARHSSAAADFGNIADGCGLAQAVPAALRTTPCCSVRPNRRIPKRDSEKPCRSRRFLTTSPSSRPVFGWGGFFASEREATQQDALAVCPGMRKPERRHGVVHALSASEPEPAPELVPEAPAVGKSNASCAAAHTSSKPKGRSACPPLVRMSDR